MKQILNNISKFTLSIMREGLGVGLLMMCICGLAPQGMLAQSQTPDITVSTTAVSSCAEGHSYVLKNKVENKWLIVNGDGKLAVTDVAPTSGASSAYIFTALTGNRLDVALDNLKDPFAGVNVGGGETDMQLAPKRRVVDLQDPTVQIYDRNSKLIVCYNGVVSFTASTDHANTQWYAYEVVSVGDLNNDGKLTIADLTQLIQLLNQGGTITNKAADVNKDGSVTVADVEKLRDKVLGVVPNLIEGKFSVSATKKVQFTKGNLQATYNGTTREYTWGFAENQWDYLGDAASNQGNTSITCEGKNTDGKVVDIFCWSTDATNSNWGIHTNTTSDAYTGGNFKDWGELFPGKNYSTLSSGEWKYLLNTFNETSGARTQANRFAKAMVNDVKGLLIFPDGYNGTTAVTGIDGIAAVNAPDAEFPQESIPTATWTTMESDGVVFLPAAGYRDEYRVYDAGSYGIYWSSTASGSDCACYMDFHKYFVSPDGFQPRYYGRSVRLVSVIE